MTLILEVVLAALLGGLAVMIVNRLAFDALLAHGRLCTPSSATVEVTTVQPANDAVLGLPKMAGRFYQNNRGSATVVVNKVTDDQDDSSKRSIKKERM